MSNWRSWRWVRAVSRWVSRIRKRPLDPVLREFVYMDQATVTSLTVSKLGPIPTEVRESLTESTRHAATSTLKATAGPLTSALGANFEASRTRGSEVVSQSVIQDTFRRLHAAVADDLILRTDHQYPSVSDASITPRT
ncbi:MAG: DUF6414 family protein, partial [Actinomycetota bacterium]